MRLSADPRKSIFGMILSSFRKKPFSISQNMGDESNAKELALVINTTHGYKGCELSYSCNKESNEFLSLFRYCLIVIFVGLVTISYRLCLENRHI